MPNSAAISCADFPLFCHSATASRLNAGSNFLRVFFVGTAASFIIDLSFFYLKQYPSNRSNLIVTLRRRPILSGPVKKNFEFVHESHDGKQLGVGYVML